MKAWLILLTGEKRKYKPQIYYLIILLSIISLLSFSQDHKEVFSKDIFISKELSGTIKLYDNGVPTFTPLDQIVIDAHFEEIKY